jgi:hypothetical protein
MAVTHCNILLCRNYVGIEFQPLVQWPDYNMTSLELVAELCRESVNEVQDFQRNV